MVTSLYVTLVALIVLLTIVWAVARARRIRAEAAARENAALATMMARGGSAAEAGETEFVAGLPTGMPTMGGIEVAEVVDIDALLANEAQAVASRARAVLEEPTNIHLGLDTLPPAPRAAPPAPVAAPVRPVIAAVPPPVPRAAPAPRPAASDVALRELTLTWFEARGYRPSPASPAVRPVELVLRHKDDPSRAYAFVVERSRLDEARVGVLVDQVKKIGLVRLLIAAEGGADAAVPAQRRGVRVLDRAALDAELRKLDISVAARIIAVARKRSAAHAA
jgi:hypothetical protein